MNTTQPQTRVAILGVILRNMDAVEPLNAILHEHANEIIGRMGLPYPAKNLRLISVALDAPESVISALTNRIAALEGVAVNTAFAPPVDASYSAFLDT